MLCLLCSNVISFSFGYEERRIHLIDSQKKRETLLALENFNSTRTVKFRLHFPH